MTESLALMVPVLLVAGAAAAFFLPRSKSPALPAAVPPPPPIEMAPPPGVAALQGDLLQLRFDAHIAGIAAARDVLDTTLDHLFEVASRTIGGPSVVDALRDTVRERLRPAALKDDPAAVLAANGPLEEVLLLLPLGREAVDEVRTQSVKNALRMIRNLPAPSPKPVPLADLRPGDALRIEGRPFLVMERHRYREDYEGRTWTWHELRIQDLRNAKLTGLDLEQDDELEAWLQTDRFGLSDLGIEPKRLAYFDDEESGSVNHRGTRFHYADSGAARFFSHEGADSDPFEYWEFESDDGREAVAVERWDKARYEAFRMRKVETSDIETIPLLVSPK
ncbi:MAG: DUF4178 domain-containing protein [Fimbriimonas sp.]